MRVLDLDLRELLAFDPKGGTIRFAGNRALLLDAVALGLLRKELIEKLGFPAAKAILTRFGYAHGWRTAESLSKNFPWEQTSEWRRAGGRLHTLQGYARVEPAPPRDGEPPFAEALLTDSFEAEQHLLHLGRSSEPACVTLAGFGAGYLSYVNGREVVMREESCVARGDAVCRVVGRFREDWPSPSTPYDRAALDASLSAITKALLDRERHRAVPAPAPARPAPAPEGGGLVAESGAMRRVLDLARRVAKVESTVLVDGESGTGKERIATLIHAESRRAAGPFVPVNCGAITESLLESELFGHARGSFTGATEDRVGLFEAASGGTIFLDEVGEMGLAMQAKLLRTLQEREVRRVGESRTRKIDVRVLCATNRDLAREVEAGRFRKDLYYRLAVVEIRIPPLRDRPEDVLPIAHAMLPGIARKLGKPVHGISPQAAEALRRHRWPGNVRELENALEQAAALCDGDLVEVGDLPEAARGGPAPASPPAEAAGGRTLEEVEKAAILAALEANGGNQVKTAAALGIGTATLYRKLKRWRQDTDGA